jgi:DNA-binding transcriptional MerR regulator
MEERSLTLVELAEKTGIESRTIRSYIERGLLPNADSRGRGAGYTQEHLTRLLLIKSIRKARPNVQLNEIRLLFQQSSPDQIRNLAAGSFTASAAAVTRAIQGDEVTEPPSAPAELPSLDISHPQEDGTSPTASTAAPPDQLTAAERLAVVLRQLTGHTPAAGGSRVETWHRIVINADVELSVRGFGPDQLVVFREVADLLGHLLARTDLPSQEGEE